MSQGMGPNPMENAKTNRERDARGTWRGEIILTWRFSLTHPIETASAALVVDM